MDLGHVAFSKWGFTLGLCVCKLVSTCQPLKRVSKELNHLISICSKSEATALETPAEGAPQNAGDINVTLNKYGNARRSCVLSAAIIALRWMDSFG